jgi:hypothetical protein
VNGNTLHERYLLRRWRYTYRYFSGRIEKEDVPALYPVSRERREDPGQQVPGLPGSEEPACVLQFFNIGKAAADIGGRRYPQRFPDLVQPAKSGRERLAGTKVPEDPLCHSHQGIHSIHEGILSVPFSALYICCPVSRGKTKSETRRTSWEAAPGTYFFRCDIHPATMIGTFRVT